MATKKKTKTIKKAARKQSPQKRRTKTKTLGATPKRGGAKKAVTSAVARDAKKSSANTIVMTTLAVGAAGILGYFGWQLYKKKQDRRAGNLDNELLKSGTYSPSIPGIVLPSDTSTYTPPSKSSSGYTPPPVQATTNDQFPLRKGSKGSNVKALQQALIGKYGKSILPRYGADGDFGSETATALAKAGLPSSIDESTFQVLLQGNGSNGFDASSLAKKLYDAAVAKNYANAIKLLKQLKSQDEYAQVSEAFKTYRLRGVRQTLVNGMLSSFSTNTQKQNIRLEFLRMGLKYDGKQWSLSGFDGKPIVSIEPATVWISPTESLQVPAMMVLGSEVTRRLDYTMFENKGKFFLVKTQSIKYV